MEESHQTRDPKCQRLRICRRAWMSPSPDKGNDDDDDTFTRARYTHLVIYRQAVTFI